MIHPTFSGILTYRLFKDGPKPILKIVHAVIMITVFMLTVIALIAVFDFHNLNLKPIPNMYSVHSWMGLLTVILFCAFICFCTVPYMFEDVPIIQRGFNNKNLI